MLPFDLDEAKNYRVVSTIVLVADQLKAHFIKHTPWILEEIEHKDHLCATVFKCTPPIVEP